jgi:hypothetical protein
LGEIYPLFPSIPVDLKNRTKKKKKKAKPTIKAKEATKIINHPDQDKGFFIGVQPGQFHCGSTGDSPGFIRRAPYSNLV